MNIAYARSFAKDLRQISDDAVLKRLQEIIQEIESAARLQDLQNLKKIVSARGYYRLRIGDYRVGLIIEAETVTFIRILHRKEIYRFFP